MLRINKDQFESILVYKSLTDVTYLSKIIEVIDPKHFKDKNVKILFTIIKDFYNRRSIAPTVTEIKTYLHSQEEKDAFREVVTGFTGIDKNLNGDELLENTERYIKERSIWHTMVDLSDDITSGKIDSALILDRFEKCCNINLKLDIGLDIIKNFDKVKADILTDQPVISTGYKFLDEKLGGGFLTNGRAIYVFIGETNIGKSIVLGNFATNIANQGKTVLLVTLEMSELVYAKRLASNLTKIPMKDFRTNFSQLEASIKQYAYANPNNRIIIKEFPPSTITTNQLSGYIKGLISSGIKIDAIVLDYINLLKGPTGDNSYERVKIVAEQTRALSYIFNCPIVSASQIGRCLDVNTMVSLGNGKQIKIGDVKVGQQIEGDTGMVTVRYIYPISKKRSYKITLKSGRTVICSRDHLFPVEGVMKNISSGLAVGDILTGKLGCSNK